jgi:hypothetical protein
VITLLKLIIRMKIMRVWTRLIWLRTGMNDGLL